jgi:hypothetical protein
MDMARHSQKNLWLVLLVAVCCSVSLHAAPKPAGTFAYDVEHERYGNIGTHIVTVKPNADDLIVEVKSRIKVKRLFWTYRFEADQKEVWREGRLVAFDRSTRDDFHDDGKEVVVRAHAQGDKLIIDGPSGRTEAPGTILSSHPWNPKIVQQTVLMDAKTGELKKVGIKPLNKEWVTIGEKPVRARKYVVSGELQQELWYDERGKCVRARFKGKDGFITVKLANMQTMTEPIRISQVDF